MRLGRGWVLIVGALAFGCGSTKAPVGAHGAARSICDGSEDIRLAFKFDIGSGRVRSFTSVLYDLGSDFLYVDGTCRYWVQQPTLPVDEYVFWRPYREGTLTADQEQMLHDAIGYDDVSLGPVAGACTGEGIPDQSNAVLWDGERVRSCTGSFDVPENWPARDVLFAAASPVVGSVRMQVGLDNVPPGATVYPWPLTKSPESYLVDYLSTASTLVDDPSEVDTLRQLRDRALADAEGAPVLFPGVIVVEPPGYVRKQPDETFVMSLRDDLPFTSSDGTWSPP